MFQMYYRQRQERGGPCSPVERQHSRGDGFWKIQELFFDALHLATEINTLG